MFGKRISNIERNPKRTIHRQLNERLEEQEESLLVSRSERERWIREKYEQKLFLAPWTIPSSQIKATLTEAISKADLSTVIFILAHRKFSSEDLNSSLLHLAASQGNVTILQLLLWVRQSKILSRSSSVRLCLQYGAEPFAPNASGSTPLQCAQGDCIQVLQTLTNNQTDFVPANNTFPRPRAPATSPPGPPYDKLPSTVI